MAGVEEQGCSETKKITPPCAIQQPSPLSADQLNSDGVAGFIRRLQLLQADISQLEGPILLAEGVSEKAFMDCDYEGAARLFLDIGRVYIKEAPSEPHEMVAGTLDNCFAHFPGNSMQILRSPRIAYGSGPTVHETDCSYRNRFEPRVRTGNNVLMPAVIGDGCSETERSLRETAEHYMRNDHVQMVISIKIVKRNDLVDAMVCIVHSKVGGRAGDHLQKIISFGPRLRSVDKERIVSCYHPDPGMCVGVDMGVAYPYVADNPLFIVQVPTQVIWMNVPEGTDIGDCNRTLPGAVHLHSILNDLIEDGLVGL